MLKLECNSCFETYDADTSDALLRHMYCSKSCEDAEDERLTEANHIVDSALANNPSILDEQRAKLREIDLRNAGLSGIIQFSKEHQGNES